MPRTQSCRERGGRPHIAPGGCLRNRASPPHRAQITGPPLREARPSCVQKTLRSGLHVQGAFLPKWPHVDDVGSTAWSFPSAPAGFRASARGGGRRTRHPALPHTGEHRLRGPGGISLPPGGSAHTRAADFLPAPLGSRPRSRCHVQGQEALPGFPLGLVCSGSELLSVCGAGRGHGVLLL